MQIYRREKLGFPYYGFISFKCIARSVYSSSQNMHGVKMLKMALTGTVKHCVPYFDSGLVPLVAVIVAK